MALGAISLSAGRSNRGAASTTAIAWNAVVTQGRSGASAGRSVIWPRPSGRRPWDPSSSRAPAAKTSAATRTAGRTGSVANPARSGWRRARSRGGPMAVSTASGANATSSSRGPGSRLAGGAGTDSRGLGGRTRRRGLLWRHPHLGNGGHGGRRRHVGRGGRRGGPCHGFGDNLPIGDHAAAHDPDAQLIAGETQADDRDRRQGANEKDRAHMPGWHRGPRPSRPAPAAARVVHRARREVRSPGPSAPTTAPFLAAPAAGPWCGCLSRSRAASRRGS